MSEDQYRELARERFSRRPSWTFGLALPMPRDPHDVHVPHDDEVTVRRRCRDLLAADDQHESEAG